METDKKGRSMRKRYTADFRARVALEAIKGERSVSELASHYEVHPNHVTSWKKQLLEEMPGIFSDKRKREKLAEEDDKSKLYEEIGRLKIEVDWLRYNLDLTTEGKRMTIERDHSSLPASGSYCSATELLISSVSILVEEQIELFIY
jgi:transposase-like protein